jgi:hypothetical protein
MQKKTKMILGIIAILAIIGISSPKGDNTPTENIVYSTTIYGDGKYIDTTLFLTSYVVIGQNYTIKFETNMTLYFDFPMIDAIELIELTNNSITIHVLEVGINPTLWIKVISMTILPTNTNILVKMIEL